MLPNLTPNSTVNMIYVLYTTGGLHQQQQTPANGMFRPAIWVPPTRLARRRRKTKKEANEHNISLIPDTSRLLADIIPVSRGSIPTRCVGYQRHVPLVSRS